MNLQDEWHYLWNRNAVGDPAEQFAALLDAYNQPHRTYHNLDHIQDCLQQLENCAVISNDADAVKLAIWLHDVVYEIGASDNEERSAQWAANALQQVEPGLLNSICELILATKHPSIPLTADAKLVVDIDLSILGRPPPEFAQYETSVRNEYQQIPDAQYCSGRAKILRGFLDRPSIYFTDYFREKFEAQARQNLAESIAALEAGGE